MQPYPTNDASGAFNTDMPRRFAQSEFRQVTQVSGAFAGPAFRMKSPCYAAMIAVRVRATIAIRGGFVARTRLTELDV